jgi:biopolymer transport protein ExbD
MKFSQAQEDLEVNMTPMIDIVFQLLTFFTMISTMNRMEREAKLDLPEANAAVVDEMATQRMIVNIERDGTIKLFGLRATKREFANQLRQRKVMLLSTQRTTGSAPIVIRADQDTEYKNVREVLDIIRAEKFPKILFAAWPPPPEKQPPR